MLTITIIIFVLIILLALCFEFCVKRIDDGQVAYKISIFNKEIKTIKSGNLVFVLPYFDQLKIFSLQQYELKLPRDYTDDAQKDDNQYAGLDEKSWRTQDEFVRLRFKMIFSIAIEKISDSESLRSSLAEKSKEEICEYAYEIARPVIDGYLLTITGHNARRHPELWKDALKTEVSNALIERGIQIVYFEPYSHKKNDDSVRFEYEEAVEKTRISKEKAVKLAENKAEEELLDAKIQLLEKKKSLANEEAEYRIKLSSLAGHERTAEILAESETYKARIELRENQKLLEVADSKAKKACAEIDIETQRIAFELERERLNAYTEANNKTIETSGDAAAKLKPEVYFAGSGASGFDSLTFSTLKGIDMFKNRGVLSEEDCEKWKAKILGRSVIKMDLNSSGIRMSKDQITRYMIELILKKNNPNPTDEDIDNFQMLDEDELLANTVIDSAYAIGEYASVDKVKEFVENAVERAWLRK